MKQIADILGKGWLMLTRNALLIACVVIAVALFVTAVSLPSTPVSDTVIYTTSPADSWTSEP